MSYYIYNASLFRGTVCGLIAAALAACAGCAKSNAEGASETSLEQVKKPVVLTVRPERAGSSESAVFSGVARESRTVRAAFRVSGPIVEICDVIGTKIAKGEPIAKIDPRDFELAVKQAEEGLKEAESAYSAMQTGARAEDVAALEAAEAAAQSRYDNAKINEERFARLLEKKSVPQAKYDEVRTLCDQAAAALEGAKQNLAKAKTGARREDLDAMEAKVAGLKTVLGKARNSLNDATLRAPGDGYVSQKYAEEGEFVGAGTPVLAFSFSDAARVRTFVPESVVTRRAEIAEFLCEFESYPDRVFPATLREIGLAQQAGKQGYPLEVEIAPQEDAEILPGMTGTVRIIFNSSKNEFVLPLQSLAADDDADSEDGEWTGKTKAAYVWRVAEGDRLERTPVTLERVTSEGAVVSGDISVEDRIVSAGARFLRENEEVRIR